MSHTKITITIGGDDMFSQPADSITELRRNHEQQIKDLQKAYDELKYSISDEYDRLVRENQELSDMVKELHKKLALNDVVKPSKVGSQDMTIVIYSNGWKGLGGALGRLINTALRYHELSVTDFSDVKTGSILLQHKVKLSESKINLIVE